MILAPRAGYHSDQLTVRDALEAFDNWDYVAWRPGGRAYGAVMFYVGGRRSLEDLTRAVLLDRGLDPEHWQESADVVHSAFQIWMGLTRPYEPGDELDEHRGTA